MSVTKLSKKDILQFFGGALCSLPLNLVMLIFLIGSVRLFETAIATWPDTTNPASIVRLILFVPPIFFSGAMLVLRRKHHDKLFFWTGALIFQILLWLVIRPNFDM